MNVIESAPTEKILKFKLACKSHVFSEEDIENLFLNYELNSEQELEEILKILLQHRPKIYKKYEDKIKRQ